MCPPDHKHDAATTCYIRHRCGCEPCRVHHRENEQRRRRLKAYGQFDTGLVDAAPVRAHLLMLSEYGIGYKRTARLAGVGTTATRQVLYGRDDPARKGERPKRMKRETAEKILAVRPSLDLLGDLVLVDAAPYVRRVQALVALGWSQQRVSTAIGVTRGNFRLVRYYETDPDVKIAAKTARKIVAIYDELSNQRPPERTGPERSAASRARRTGRERGWPLPMDWEAVDNDFTQAITRSDLDPVNRRDATHALDEAEWLLRAGTHPLVIAQTLGSSLVALERNANRYGRHDLANALHIAPGALRSVA